MNLGTYEDANELLKMANNHNYLILKLSETNRDYDVYCNRQFSSDLREGFAQREIEYIEINYNYVVRLFVFSNYNVAIDLIVEPRIKNRVYRFEDLTFSSSNTFVATKEQNELWRCFQNNDRVGPGMYSSITLASTFKYFVILMRIQFCCCGFTFSGPDGSGKSSTVEKVQFALNVMKVPYGLRRQVYGVFPRPAIVLGRKPNIEHENRNPNGGTQKGFLLSSLVSIYYLCDYVAGMLFWLFRRNKYKVLVFDRYVMDFVVNIERNALHKSFKHFFKFFIRLLTFGYKHYLCFAPAEIIHARKKELDIETISRLNKAYINLNIKWHVWRCW